MVHLSNGLANNGTGLHFHGMRQNMTNQQDGVPSITQCPTAPGDVRRRAIVTDKCGQRQIQLTKFGSLSLIHGEQLNTALLGTIRILLSRLGKEYWEES